MSKRTPRQKQLDSIDCDLYRVLVCVEKLSNTDVLNTPWRRSMSDAVKSLKHARTLIRRHMHEDDVAATN